MTPDELRALFPEDSYVSMGYTVITKEQCNDAIVLLTLLGAERILRDLNTTPTNATDVVYGAPDGQWLIWIDEEYAIHQRCDEFMRSKGV